MKNNLLKSAPIFNDIKELTLEKLKKLLPESSTLDIDLVTGGFPCQDLSVAGPHAGLGACRSGLLYELIRIIEDVNPKYILLENVSQVVNDESYMNIILKINTMGYSIAWGMFSAAEQNFPHYRKRWFLYGHRRGIASHGSILQQLDEGKRISVCGTGKNKNIGEFPSTFIEKTSNDIRFSHRYMMIGNSLVPDVARNAFRELMTKVLSAESKSPGIIFYTSIDSFLMRRKKKTKYQGGLLCSAPRCGDAEISGQTFFDFDWRKDIKTPPSPDWETIVVTPPEPPEDSGDSTRVHDVVRKPYTCQTLLTPVRSERVTHSNYLTRRTKGHLFTQLLFCSLTPPPLRSQALSKPRLAGVNPNFLEYIMGYPPGWTDLS